MDRQGGTFRDGRADPLPLPCLPEITPGRYDLRELYVTGGQLGGSFSRHAADYSSIEVTTRYLSVRQSDKPDARNLCRITGMR